MLQSRLFPAFVRTFAGIAWLVGALGACTDAAAPDPARAEDGGAGGAKAGAAGDPVGPGASPSMPAAGSGGPVSNAGAAGAGGGGGETAMSAGGRGGSGEPSSSTTGGEGGSMLPGAGGTPLGGAPPSGDAGASPGGANPGGGTSDGGASPGGASSGGAAGAAGSAGAGPSTSGVDVFGVETLYPSAPSGAAWDSSHWSESGAYALSARRDDNDPSGLSGMRGEGELFVEDGELVMSGSQPRIYVYPGDGWEWLNVEVTVYYRRVADADTSYAGLVIGVRSGPDGHTSDTPCDAHTYYSRLRNDGRADFEKELEHSPSSTRASTSLADFLPPDGEASASEWVGWKYVSYNLPGEAALKLEAYIDLTQGENGGDWQLVHETIDDGRWFTDTSCERYSPVDGESDFIWLEGGTVFIRNTDVEEARYRWFSIREIVPR